MKNILIVSDEDSWINSYISDIIYCLIKQNKYVFWRHDLNNSIQADVCIYLSYSKIVSKDTLNRFKYNLVVHESSLPKGKGWSPLTWQIIEGNNNIVVTLFEAKEEVDSGKIYEQVEINFSGYELIDELRKKQAEATKKLLFSFFSNYEKSNIVSYDQIGQETFYKRRTPKDSELDINKTIAEQFNLLRTVDNDKYPAFFKINGHKYILNIYHE